MPAPRNANPELCRVGRGSGTTRNLRREREMD
jgi:hypothetical protein